MGNTKLYFHQKYYALPALGFCNEAIDSLFSQQGINIDLSGNRKVVVIYSGNTWGEGVLNPRADMSTGKYYVMSERKDFYSNGSAYENSANFAHIGVHCHEFGHLLGLPDRYTITKEYVMLWDLMSKGGTKGVWNGSNYIHGNCPSPMNPQDLRNLGWLTYDIIPAGKNLNVAFASNLNKTYKINVEAPISVPEYYVIQNRQASVGVWNLENRGSGLLIWQIRDNGVDESRRFLKPADGNTDPDRNWDVESVPFPGTTNKRYANDFVAPRFVFNCLDSNSNIVIRNISNSAATMTADVNTFWCDSLKESMTWKANVKVGGDLIIPSGVTLTIHQGANVKVSPGVKIYVYGTLNASGSSTDSITFTSSVPSERWGGIVLSGSGAGSSVFSYCKFNNVQTYGGSVLSFTNMTGNPVVQYCNISGNANYGTSAIVYSNSNGYLMKNRISYNAAGVSCNSGATPMFGRAGYYYSCSSGNNRIINNSSLGVTASNSTPYVGSSGISNLMGNSLHSNISSNLSASGSSYLNAENVWWGSSTPDASKITTSGGAIIQYNSWCTSEPQYKMRAIDNVSDTVNLRMSKTENNNSSLSSEYPALSDPFEEAIVLIMNESYDKAFTIYKNILTASKEKQQIEKSLFGLLTLFRAKPSNGILDYLEQYGKVNTEMKPTVDYVIGNSLVVTDKTDEAIAKYQSVINDGKDPNMVRAAKIGLIKAYHFNKGEKELANLEITELRNDPKSLAPAEEIELEFINWLINGKITNFKKEESQNKENSNESKNTIGFSLSNYPNPFNPSTTIRYSIPQDLHVKLKVYDITGKEVAVLVNEMKQAGEYNVEFSAGKYASGVYYYKLQAGSYKNIQKMVLVK